METNKFTQKCGEILIDIKSKNKKNKIFIFQCTFCDIQCDQLKKFSLHIGEEHLNAFDEILKETEISKETEFIKETSLKFEAEPEEIKIPSFTDIEETADIKVFEGPIETKAIVNPDPLDTVNSATTSTHTDNLNCEIKYEIIEHEDEEPNEMGIMDGTVSISDSDKSDSDEDYIDEVPSKKRKTPNKNIKKPKQMKRKENSNETDSDDDSKDAECNAKKEKNAIKKHKRCKRRWKTMDETKLPLLIEMYKKYEVLWQVNDVAFGIASKRNECFEEMLTELKTKHNFEQNLDELLKYIDYLNNIYSKDKEQQLKCEINKTVFEPATKYYENLKFLNESQGPFKCDSCNEIIKKYDRYRIHVAKHTDAVPFPCKLCEMGFQYYDNYLLHVKRHLGINSYHCSVCGKGYPVKAELEWHLTSHTGVKPFLCSICGNGFRTRHHYDNHVRRHEKRFRFECQVCKHGFNHPGSYKSHVKTHFNIRDIICNICGKGFTGKKYLQRHTKNKHEEEEKRFKCNICDRAFSTERGFNLHQKYH